MSTQATITIFVSYAREDEGFCRDLEKHLEVMKRQQLVRVWHNRNISAGTDWAQQMSEFLNTADIILLLISPDFLASDYCYDKEMKCALERHQRGEARVIPLILRPCDWKSSPFAHLQCLPRDDKPVTRWDDLDEAFELIAQGIRSVVKALRQGVFIAFSPLDRLFVKRLSQDLAARGVVIENQGQVQLQQALVQGEPTHQAIRTASVVLLVASPEAPYSRMLEEHLKLATLLNKPMIVVWASGDDWDKTVPKGCGKQDTVDARGERYERALTELIARLRSRISTSLFAITSSDTQEILFEPRNPYKGLRAFSPNDAGDFFGRATLIDELVDGLQASLVPEKRGNLGSRLLTVIGPSGSGKSSVVMAGLLPRLQSGKVVLNSDEWVYLDRVLPGTHPLEALAVALARELPERGASSLQKDLESDNVRMLHVLAAQIVRRPETKVKLLIDQFEELFSPMVSEEEREHFIDLLVTAVTEPHGPTVVILTLRADFYDRPMSYPSLSRIMQQHLVQVLPMSIQDLRAVIEQPALLPDVVLTFESELVSYLLLEMKGQEGALPLLEFTLEQLFQRRKGHLLTLQAYDEIGGVKGALAKQAEFTYADLPSGEHRQLARALFMRLIDPGTTEQDTTRRRAALSEFSLADATRTRLLRETIETFIDDRLLTTNKTAGTTTIEVSHESLIREWARLAGWLRDARQDIPLQQAISKDVAEWERRGKSVDRLYRGSQLDEALAWSRHNWPSRQEEAFLQTSVDEHERQQRVEEERKLHECQQQTRYTRRVFLVGVAGLGLALVAGVTVEIVVQYESQFVHLPYTYLKHTNIVDSVAWSPDGSKLASGSWDLTVQVWDARTGQTLLTYRGHTALKDIVESVAWSPDGSKLASANLNTTVQVWDAHTGQTLLTYRGHKDGVSNVAWSPDGSKLASASADGTAQVWDAHTNQTLLIYRRHKDLVNSVAWSPDGSKLASTSYDGTVQVWDAHTGQSLLTYQSYPVVVGVAWSPDGSKLASGSRGNETVQVWDARTGQTLFTRAHMNGESVVWSPDGRKLASGGIDETVQVWDAHTGQTLLTYRGHKNYISSVAWSPDGSKLASASGDGTVQEWLAP